VMKLPDSLINFRQSDYIVLKVSNGLLFILIPPRHGPSSCNIWLMKEYGVVESWTKQYTIDLGGWFYELHPLKNNKKIFGVEPKKPFLYDLETDIFISLENLIMKNRGFFYATNTIVESLVLLNQVNALQKCQSCLKEGRWCVSKKAKERKRIEKKDMQKKMAKQSTGK
jgi:hypothetical protein